jgi:riboflavin biosynthesis pyrimidine reductase
VRQLFPSPVPRTPERPCDPDLAALYAYPPGPWLRGNMVASADGAGSLAGVSAGLSSDADRQVFMLLRALADVILVGSGTVRAEHYGPARRSKLWSHLRAGRPATAPIAVVSARLDLDPASRLFTEAPPDARTIVITTAQAPAALRAGLAPHADIVIAGEATVDVRAAVRALADRGHQRILTEGGPHLLAQFAAAGLLDELCLTIGPLLAGPGPGRILSGDPFPAGPLPLTLAHVLEDGGFLLCRYTTHLCRTIGGAPAGEPFTASGAARAQIPPLRRRRGR